MEKSAMKRYLLTWHCYCPHVPIVVMVAHTRLAQDWAILNSSTDRQEEAYEVLAITEELLMVYSYKEWPLFFWEYMQLLVGCSCSSRWLHPPAYRGSNGLSRLLKGKVGAMKLGEECIGDDPWKVRGGNGGFAWLYCISLYTCMEYSKDKF